MRFYKFYLFLFFIASCGVKFSSPESQNNTYQLTTEKQLLDANVSSKIDSFYKEGDSGRFLGKNDVSIYYKMFRQKSENSPAIVISSGRTEAAIKYKELIYDFYKNGYSVYIHDHRGQGLSGRMTENKHMGYVKDFQFYVDDFKKFIDSKVKVGKHSSMYLVAHSMGGAIGMMYLEQFPQDFKAAAFSSPMLGLKSLYCFISSMVDEDNIKFAMGQGDYQKNKSTFDKNQLTNSKVRYDRMLKAFEKDKNARLGGATYQWIEESCEQFKEIRRKVGNIETPFILFSAEDETIVVPNAHQKFINAANKKGVVNESYLIEDAKHELFIEKDVSRIKTINLTLDYFRKYQN